jgi:hypothetical protein
MLLAALVLVVGWVGPMAGTASAATSLDFAIPNGHFYTQANGQGGAGGTGFAITDDASAKFWSEFQRLGGVNSLGYPVSGRFMWDGFLDQATQRVVMQWRPDTHQVLFVNTYDRLHDLGKDAWLQAFRNTPPPASTAPDTGLPFAQVEARHLAYLNSDPAIKAKYYATAAIGDPIVYNGLPMGPVTPEGPFTMLRCQRVTIQHWLVDSPASGAHKGDVDVTLGGDDAKASGALPDAAALVPSAPPVTPPGVTPPASGFVYGFQAQLYGNQELPVLGKISGAGFGWVKQQVVWSDIQPNSPGDQNWGELDTIVNRANASGTKVLLSIVQAPNWARANPANPYPKNPSDLASFFTSMATRYKGKVGAYEVWNEENFAREVGPGNINAGNYVELLKAASTAIRAADPKALVVSGAPTPTGVNDPNIAIDDNAYLQQMYAYQGGIVKSYFDVLGAHAEAWANPPDAKVGTPEPANVTGFNNHPSFFFRRLEDYRNDMVAAGDGSKKIWETEFGYDSCQGDAIPAPAGYEYCKWVSEQQQASYEVGAFQYAHTNYPWLGGIFIWNLNFQAVVAPSDEKWGFGVLRSDYSPRPAYSALAVMAKP